MFPIQQIRSNVRNKQLSNILPLQEDCLFFPKTLTIETTNICNAFCTFCPHPRMKRNQTMITTQLYEKIIRESKELGVEEVVLSFFGEPFCDRNLMNRIKFAKENGLKVTLYTNAILLDSDKSKELIDANLDKIFISLDAYSSEHYRKIRLVGKYDEVVDNINNLIEMKETRKSKFPIVEIGMILLDKEDKKGVKTFIKQWKKADNVVIRQPHDWISEGTDIKNQLPCYPLWNDFYILCDGRVVPCCMDYDGTYILGNTNEQTLKEIWETSEKLKMLRKLHLKNTVDSLILCKNCTVINSSTYPWWYFK
jgi:radical SAM protein with 4Fe4S-binding SPASM domain